MNVTETPTEESPHAVDCSCPRLTEGLGKLYGISMGDKGDRISADPDCPVHGGDA